MVCHEPCVFKRDAVRLKDRIAALENGLELEKLQNAYENEKRAKLNAVNDRDRMRKSVEEGKKTIGRLRETIEGYKDKLVWAEEDLEQEKKTADKKIRELKKKVNDLEKALSDAAWKQEKQQKESEKQLRKELAMQKASYEKIIADMDKKHQEEIAEKEEKIQSLKAHLQGRTEAGKAGKKEPLLETVKTDSTTSSVPPGLDPNHPKITNNRTPSGLKPGAQKGHEAHPRKRYAPTETVVLPPPEEVRDHPDEYYETGIIKKQRVSVRLIIKVVEYIGKKYRSHKTRAVVHSDFPDDLGHLEVNYDQTIDALTTYLHSVCNVPYNKIQELFREGTEGQVLEISTGKLASLEKSFSELSEEERAAIAENLFIGETMNLDGTPVRINGKQRQVLVMCNKENVLYKMTGCKGEEAIKGTPAENYPGITISDGESTFTKIGDNNQRCCVHEGRYLKHAEEDAPGLNWAKEMRELLQEIQHRRNVETGQGKVCMPETERKKVSARYDAVIRKGIEEYQLFCPELFEKHLATSKKKLEKCGDRYGLDMDKLNQISRRELKKDMDIYPDMPLDALNALVKDINTLLRLMTDKEHYLLFLEDYTIPPHNNDAEKCARTIKVHVKPNGGMRSEEYAGYYADTVSVLESAQRKGESRFEKLTNVFERKATELKEKIQNAIEKSIGARKNKKEEPAEEI